ncbi:MAG: helix-turn-helix transcriptional regulator [Solirubrobacterales bacterium]
MKRKSIRLTANSYALMALLDQLGEATSYEIKGAIEKSIANFWPLPHTTAYEEPARLQAAGYLSVRQESAGRRRKVYALTEKGRAALRKWAAEPSAAPPQVRDEHVLKVFAGADLHALVEERRAWHREKLIELQGYLNDVRDSEGWVASEQVLATGLAYHRKMLELLEQVEGDGGAA